MEALWELLEWREAHHPQLDQLRRHGSVAPARALEVLGSYRYDVALRASRLTAWVNLPHATRLEAHETAGQLCAITLDSLGDLVEPVAIRTDQVVHIFSFHPLLFHWVMSGTNPLTREVIPYERLLRVESVAGNTTAPSEGRLDT